MVILLFKNYLYLIILFFFVITFKVRQLADFQSFAISTQHKIISTRAEATCSYWLAVFQSSVFHHVSNCAVCLLFFICFYRLVFDFLLLSLNIFILQLEHMGYYTRVLSLVVVLRFARHLLLFWLWFIFLLQHSLKALSCKFLRLNQLLLEYLRLEEAELLLSRN